MYILYAGLFLLLLMWFHINFVVAVAEDVSLIHKIVIVVTLLESAEVSKDDKDSGLDVLVFGADVNSDEACAQRSK